MKLTPIALAFLAANTYAECIMNSSSATRTVGKIEDVADIRPMVSPVVNGQRKCFINMRVKYKNEWHTVYSEYSGTMDNADLCQIAVEQGARQFLADHEPRLLHSEQQMLCSDAPAVTYNSTVAKGDRIRISEVRPHPVQKQPFQYKGTECRWFVEPSMKGNDFYQWQGVACKTGMPGSDEWTVIDKF